MKFYSYEFLLRRNVGMNRVQLIIAAVLFLILLVNGLRYFKDKQSSRHREPAPHARPRWRARGRRVGGPGVRLPSLELVIA